MLTESLGSLSHDGSMVIAGKQGKLILGFFEDTFDAVTSPFS